MSLEYEEENDKDEIMRMPEDDNSTVQHSVRASIHGESNRHDTFAQYAYRIDNGTDNESNSASYLSYHKVRKNTNPIHANPWDERWNNPEHLQEPHKEAIDKNNREDKRKSLTHYSVKTFQRLQQGWYRVNYFFNKPKHVYGEIYTVPAQHLEPHERVNHMIGDISRMNVTPVKTPDWTQRTRHGIRRFMRDVFIANGLIIGTFIIYSSFFGALSFLTQTHHRVYAPRPIVAQPYFHKGDEIISALNQPQLHDKTIEAVAAAYSSKPSAENRSTYIQATNFLLTHHDLAGLKLLDSQGALAKLAKTGEFNPLLNVNYTPGASTINPGLASLSDASFATEKYLLDQGFDWRAQNYQFLRNTANSEQWRGYWTHYLKTQHPELVSTYDYILKDNLSPQMQDIISTYNNLKG